jgi:hypothetical protein
MYNMGGGNSCDLDSYTLNAYTLQTVFPAPQTPTHCTQFTVLSANFSGGQVMAANVNQVKYSGPTVVQATTYPAIATPGRFAYISRLRNDSNWDDALVVQNVNNQAINIRVTFYNGDGTVYSSTTDSLASHALKVYFAPGFSNGGGSAVVTAEQPVAVVVNNYNVGVSSSVDGIGSYTAAPR